VLRLRGNAFSVYEEGGKKVEILEGFRGLEEGESRSIVVYGKIGGELVPLRLCGLRKDGDSERKGLKRLKKENQRKQQGKEVSEKQAEWNKYIIVMTSLGAEVSASSVLELYRARWQIELVFKRLKSLFGYNGVPMKVEGNIHAWFYGKVLLAAFCELVVAEGRSTLAGGGAGDGQQMAEYERLSLWRELYIAQVLVTGLLLEMFHGVNLRTCIRELPIACRDSKRKRKPQLCVLSSA
jgi:hypothetical protein